MRHRHLNAQQPQQPSLAAVDDIISRGTQKDWLILARILERNPNVAAKIDQVCNATIHADPNAQRHHFWRRYVKEYFPKTKRKTASPMGTSS